MIQTESKSVAQAVDFLRRVSKETPSAAVVLGSGVKVLEDLPEQVSYTYDQVFGMSPTIVGHAGSLSLGRVGSKLVAVLRGRFHMYEGHNWDVVTMPARVLVEWGVKHLYLTNAAGGLNTSFKVGDLMLLKGYRDHLNPRWQNEGLLPAVKQPPTPCENELSAHIAKSAEQLAKTDKDFRPIQQGIYAALLGPSYETLAEIEMLKKLGCDAVGMSTVPELLAAQGSATTAAAISVVTNVWSEHADIEGHEEVLRAAKEASGRLDKLFRAAIGS
jgi:purine-nucleoside phosphorylase